MATHNKEDQVETTDPFATQADSTETVADPFATTDAPPAPAAEPETPAAAPAEPEQDSSSEIPTVDREGVIVQPADADAPLTEEQVPAAADDVPPTPEEEPERVIDPATGAEVPEAPVAAVETPDAPVEPETATDGGQEPPQEPPAAPAEAPEASTEGETPAEAIEAASAGAGETPATRTPDGPGKAAIRKYKLLYQTGPRQWTEYELDPQHEEFGSYITVDADGEKWMLARNNEHAKRIGYAILGRPKDGVLLFPVPQGSYKPSRVKPAPPRPERERLVIE